jgi:hypothetical protein
VCGGLTAGLTEISQDMIMAPPACMHCLWCAGEAEYACEAARVAFSTMCTAGLLVHPGQCAVLLELQHPVQDEVGLLRPCACVSDDWVVWGWTWWPSQEQSCQGSTHVWRRS